VKVASQKAWANSQLAGVFSELGSFSFKDLMPDAQGKKQVRKAHDGSNHMSN
jgi:hypothetical protein